jgi:hypothetical protein
MIGGVEVTLRPMARLDHVVGYCGRGAVTPNLFYTQAGQPGASLPLSMIPVPIMVMLS